MDAESLQTLQEIRGGVYVLDAIGVVGLLVWLIRAGAQIAVQLHSVVTARWKSSASAMFGKKKYDKLAKHCAERLKELPNDEWALWWSARAHRELGHDELSQQQFRLALKIAPSWRKSIEPYLAEAEAREVPP